MDPELNDDGDKQTPKDKAAQAAFDAGFAGTRATGPLIVTGEEADDDVDALEEAAASTKRAPRARNKPAAAPAPAQAEGKEGEGEPAAVDPFAGLPEPVRDALARVTTMEHDLRTTRDRLSAAEGRVAAFQREKDTQRQAPATAAAEVPTVAPKPPKRERVRGELPEVAEAMDELEEQLAALRKERATAPAPSAPAPSPASAPAPGQTAEDREAEALAALDPEWGTKMNSTAFKLWTSTLAENDRLTINGTDKAIVLAGYLKKFDKFTEGVETRTREATTTSQRRDTRTARAAAPPSSGSRGLPTKAFTEEEAFEAGFNKVRTGAY